MSALHDGWGRYITLFGACAAAAIVLFVAAGRLRRGAR